ncbi:hypothetical protein K438DRAFT_1987187 [Mycena galopus ATCC 62051]|nr:hypothetical protein K438DRAFT_1987187 [Mycena galopus ATCC 62051]
MKFISVSIVFTALFMGAIANPIASPEKAADSPVDRAVSAVNYEFSCKASKGSYLYQLPPDCIEYMKCSAPASVSSCVKDGYYCANVLELLPHLRGTTGETTPTGVYALAVVHGIETLESPQNIMDFSKSPVKCTSFDYTRSTDVEKIRTTGSFCNVLGFIEGISIATSQEDIGVPLLAHGILTALLRLVRVSDLRVIVPQQLLNPYLAMLERLVVVEPDLNGLWKRCGQA